MNTQHEIYKTGKIYRYPSGIMDIIASDRPIFRPDGWEEREKKEDRKRPKGGSTETNGERSMRRARAKLRKLALANDFRWFVTLTLSPEYVDRMDPVAVVRKLKVWCSNMVQRRGLRYILVPEYHKKGGIHFHGFFSDCDLGAVLSGHKDNRGHDIYNLDRWDLGFTTAIELYDDYARAVAYVCKYIGKGEQKIGGRWYYSGGGLVQPRAELADINARDLEEMCENTIGFSVCGRRIVIANGVDGGSSDCG